MTEPLINAERVTEIFRDCMFTDAEMPEGADPPADAVRVEGIVEHYAFHPGRLEGHRDEIAELIGYLPDLFKESIAGGWSFLNACIDRNEVQWTGFQQLAGRFLALGMGLGIVEFVLKDRSMWAVMPGGVPYYVIRDVEDDHRIDFVSEVNVDVDAAPATIAGVLPGNGRRVLLSKQDTPSENGAYYYDGPGKPLVSVVEAC